MVKCPKEFLNFDTFDDDWKDYVEMEHDLIVILVSLDRGFHIMAGS